jgi:alkyl sulfatase BDS1-like metallo-beta-lactamase superfamily hydrolase
VLSCKRPFKIASECNLLEKEEKALSTDGREIRFDTHPLTKAAGFLFENYFRERIRIFTPAGNSAGKLHPVLCSVFIGIKDYKAYACYSSALVLPKASQCKRTL